MFYMWMGIPQRTPLGFPIYILLFSHKTERAYFYRKDQAENETGSLLPNRKRQITRLG